MINSRATVFRSRQTWIRGIIGLAFGAIFLWLALRQTSWGKVVTILSESYIEWLLAGIGFHALALGVRVVRWRGLLREVKTLTFKSLGRALLVGYAANNILPARLGELFRANFAGRRCGVSRLAIAGSIFAERVLDGLVLVLCLVLGRLFISGNAILNGLTAVSVLLFTSIFVALWIVGRGFGLNWFVRLPPAILSKIQSFRRGLNVMRGAGFSMAASLSLLVWLLEGFAHWSILKAVGLSLVWQEMLSIVSVVNLSTLLPSAPGFVGTYQYAYAFAVGLFGYGSAPGIAAAIAVQIFLIGSVTTVGLGLYVVIDNRIKT